MIPLILPFLTTILNKIFPNADDAAKAQLELMKMAQEGEFKQLEVNLAEANNPKLFVSGWRPFLGWCCGAIFAYTYLLQPMIVFILTASGVQLPELPKLDIGEIMPVLLGMLGLGAMRSYEKINGVASK